MDDIKARLLLGFFLGILFFTNTRAQTNHTSGWEEVIEQLSVSQEDVNLDYLLEDLPQQLININAATKEQLEQFPFLTDIQIENLLAYVYIHGQMQTIYELQMVEEMDKQTIESLLPFVYVAPVLPQQSFPRIKNILKYGKHEFLTRFDIPFYKRKGYEKDYLGPPISNSLRYNFRYKDQIQWGMTAEKDAGEPFLALHNKKGYDYYSFYFYLRNLGLLKTLAVGNYRLSFGQGLVISNDFMLGKTSSISTLSLRSNSIKKHSSTDEYNYFRGIATAIQWHDFTVSAFYSHRSLDGIATDESITSIHKTGLHRTQREADRKEVFSLQLVGGNLTYDKGSVKAGVTGIYYFFDRPYEPQLRAYSKYNIRGNYFHNISMDYKWRWNRFTFSGEVALDKRKNLAVLNTLSYLLRSDYRFMVIQRYYAHDYWAFFARSFSEGGYVQNENGYYVGMEATPIKHWKFFLSGDFFQFPWWKYLVDKPSRGFDGIAQIDFTPVGKFHMFARYQYKQKEKNYTDENKVKSVRPIYHHKFRYRISYAPTDRIMLLTTMDYNSVFPQGVKASKGGQFTQMVSYAFDKIPLKVELQGSYFHTDDYASRVYSYEKGMLYSFYTPSYYGKGNRLSAHVRWDMNRYCMIIAKYGQTTYQDREEIGSALDMIRGNKKQDLQVQLRVKF